MISWWWLIVAWAAGIGTMVAVAWLLSLAVENTPKQRFKLH